MVQGLEAFQPEAQTLKKNTILLDLKPYIVIDMLQQKITQIRNKRVRSEPLPTGSAPYTTSNFYKLGQHGLKPKARCWEHRFSINSHLQTSSPLKSASWSSGGSVRTITLGTARPAPEFYPWESLSMRCPDIESAKINGAVEANATISCDRGEEAYDLSVAMNYGYSAGSPQLLRYVTEHVELVHNPPYDNWESCLSCGTTSAIEIAFRIFCNPGDTILVEDCTYSGTIAAAKAQELNLLGIKMDENGLLPQDLDQKLNAWDVSTSRKPFVLYMIPCGQNPTGATQTTERKRAIYEVAVKHDLYIIEDDPYYFLQLDLPGGKASSAENYFNHLPSSYLSLDSCGRVLRMDTLSKILAPGLRCGWVTASAQVIEKFFAYSEVSVLSPSGPSQVMAYKLLDETWGHEGFVRWLNVLSLQYRQRRDSLLVACDRFLPRHACTWEAPSIGMFVWVHVRDCSIARELRLLSESRRRAIYFDTEERIYSKARNNGVLVSKGSWFVPDTESINGVYFRLTFAAAAELDLVEAIQRFGNAIEVELKQ